VVQFISIVRPEFLYVERKHILFNVEPLSKFDSFTVFPSKEEEFQINVYDLLHPKWMMKKTEVKSDYPKGVKASKCKK
jgi:hypothetical protein